MGRADSGGRGVLACFSGPVGLGLLQAPDRFTLARCWPFRGCARERKEDETGRRSAGIARRLEAPTPDTRKHLVLCTPSALVVVIRMNDESHLDSNANQHRSDRTYAVRLRLRWRGGTCSIVTVSKLSRRHRTPAAPARLQCTSRGIQSTAGWGQLRPGSKSGGRLSNVVQHAAPRRADLRSIRSRTWLSPASQRLSMCPRPRFDVLTRASLTPQPSEPLP